MNAELTAIAREAGFDLVAFARAQPLDGPRRAAQAALGEGRLAGMNWMDGAWTERATDVSTFLDRAQTVMVLALPYAGDDQETEDDEGTRGRVARYAAGRDYHRVFEKSLRRVAGRIRDELGGAARATVDYGPLLERPWAAASGLGWLGKSTMLLVPGLGPWVLLGVVATDLEATPTPSLRKSCGSCSRCITACPTGAISPDGGKLDARLCISYHTIENRGAIPRDLRAKFGDWVFGCDDCLTSCPVGQRAQQSHAGFRPKDTEAARPLLTGLLALDEAAFRERFQGRAIMRAKRDGLVRNACVALGNVGTAAELPALLATLRDPSALVRGHAAWAVGELVRRTDEPAEPAILALSRALSNETDGDAADEMAAALEVLGGDDPASGL